MLLEVANALWKKARRGEFPESDLNLVLAAERGALLATTDARLGPTATSQGIRLWRP